MVSELKLFVIYFAQNLTTLFAGPNVEIWFMDLPVQEIYRMELLESNKILLMWEERAQLIFLLPLL